MAKPSSNSGGPGCAATETESAKSESTIPEKCCNDVVNGYKHLVMTALEAQLIERLKKLPPNRVAEVADFVEFLAVREERAAAALRLTDGLARLDALNLPPITDEEVEAEVQASRRDRRAQPSA